MLKRILIGLFLVGFLTNAIPASAAFDSVRFNRNPGSLKLLRITPSGEDVPPGRQIVFQFNHPVVPVGRMERSAAEIPISITPEVACEWRWLNTSSLACRLSKEAALSPATRYEVAVRPGIQAEDGGTLAETITHTFITQRPKVAHTRFKTWKSPGMPEILVMFDQPVKRASVAGHLYLQTKDGKRISLHVEEDPEVRKARKRQKEGQKAPGTRFEGLLLEGGRGLLLKGEGITDEDRLAYVNKSWLVNPVEELPLDTGVRLRVEPGILSGAGPEPGVEDRVAVSFDTFPAFRFLGVRCITNADKHVTIVPGADPEQKRCNPLGGAALVFSAPVGKEPVKDHLQVTPDLRGGRKDYDPWANVYVYSRLSQPHRKSRKYFVNLPEVLKAYQIYRLQAEAEKIMDMFGRRLSEPVDMQFATDHRVPDFNLKHRVSVLESSVDTHVPVAVTNLETINLTYETLTVDGRKAGQKAMLPVTEAEDIAYYYPIKVRELIPGGSGAIQGQWDTTPPVKRRYYGDLPRWFFSQVTPYHAHVKIGHYNTLVWVTRFDNGTPVPGARVQVYTEPFGAFTDNPKTIAEAVTNADGIAMLPGTSDLDPELKVLKNYRRSKPHMFVRIQKDKDMALLPLVHDFRVYAAGGQGVYVPSYQKRRFGHIHTWGFTAQGVYKAGDTVQFKLFVRDQDNRRFIPPPRSGYTLKVIDPMGKVVHEIQDLTLSQFGAYHGEFTVPKTGAVGWYRFKLSASFTKGRWEPLRVLISDFTPAPFRVTMDLNGELFEPGDLMKVSTQAKLHAGGPYVNAQTRITATVQGTALMPQDPLAGGFRFDVYGAGARSQTVHQTEGSVNDQGLMESEFKLPEAKVLYGRLTVESAVRDDRGKYVANRATARYVGRDRYVGIRQPDWLLKSGARAKVQALVVDEHGKVKARTDIHVTVEYRETKASRVKGAGNAYLTHYEHKWVPVKECKLVSAKKPVACRFTPKKAGYYKMTAGIEDGQGRAHSSQTTRWALGPGQVLWEARPGHTLQMIPEKAEYKVGETARFMVQNPFPGASALVTVERFGVQTSWVTTLGSSAEVIEVPVTEDALPGFYVSVVVMSPRVDKPLGENQVDLGKPAFRMGYVRVPVKDPAKELKVEVKPRKAVYKPRDTVTVNLQAHVRQGKAVPIELAVAVLDESVFDLIRGGKDYYDPYKGFYRLDALDLANFNLLTRLIGIQKFEKKGASAGGDGGADLTLRSVFKFVSYWNPSIRLDTDGKATIQFQVPDNLTGWRVLAVAVTPDDRMGLGDGGFQVNQATEIRPALPNQVVEGDRFEARFTIMNRTDAPRRLHVALNAEGAIETGDGKAGKTLALKTDPYKRYTVGLRLKAGRAGEIKLKVRAGDRRDQDALQVSLQVRRKQALQASATYGTSTSNQVTERIRFPKDIRTDVGRISVVAAPTVIGGLEGAFRYLRDYPYICWEQVLTQGVMAAHYENLRAYLPESFQWEGSDPLPGRTLQEAADFQAPNGGMTYYIPLNRYADPYLSAYTAIAFNWLRESGYKIPQQVEEKLHGYLLKLLRRDVFPDFYSKGMSSTVRAVALAALAEPATARPGGNSKITLADLKRYRRHVPEMSLFGKAHYLMALTRVAGTEPMQRDVMNLIRSHANETGGKFVFTEALDFAYKRILDSSLRTNCAVLSAFLAQEDPKRGKQSSSDVPFKLVQTITQGRKQRDRWENTQENMFCMNALVEFSRVYEKDKPDMTLRAFVDNEGMGEVRFKDYKDAPKDFKRAIQPHDPGRRVTMKLERRGSGRFYYATRLFYSPAGLRSDPINSGIEVRREYSVERNGHWELLESPMRIKTGELVRVDLYVSLPAARNFVVVDDPVPGGLEPVSRDLATASTVDADKGKFKHAGGSFWYRFTDWKEYGLSFWSFYHQELRHHSTRFYSEYLPAGNYHLSYVAQAIAPGEFIVMPVHAEEMYNPDTFGQGVPAVLRVEAEP